MKTLNNLLSLMISIGLALGPASTSAEIPKNETPIKAQDEFGNEVEKVELVEVKESIPGREDVMPLALKVTFKKAEREMRDAFRRSVRDIYKAQTGQKEISNENLEKKEIIVRFAETAYSDLVKFSPENIGNQHFIHKIMMEAQSNAIKTNNSLKNVSIRLPMEIVMFYGVIATNSCMFSLASEASIGARTNLTCMDTFLNSFKDPISIAGFISFVGTSAVTQLAFNRAFDQIDNINKSLRAKALMAQYKNVASKKVLTSALARAGSHAAHSMNPLMALVRNSGKALGPIGMSFGMLGSRIFEESLRDENIQMCAKGYAFPKETKQFEKHCQAAFDSWFKGKRWNHYGVDAVGLVASSFIAHGIFGGLTYGLKQIPGKIAQGIVNGLSYTFNFGAGAPRVMAPQFEFINRALAPLAPASIGNLSLFMTVDHGFVAKITGNRKLKDQIRYLEEEKPKIEKELERLAADYAREKYPINKDFDRQLRDFQGELAALRQMKMGDVSETVTNWMNATNEFLAVYQAAHRFYRDFFTHDAKVKEQNTLERNPFEDRDYLNRVYSWIDRGDFAQRPLSALVDSVDQPITLGPVALPLSSILQGAGYDGNEIKNFPLYSKLETVSKGADQLLASLINDIGTGKRKVKDKVEVLNHLLTLQQGTDQWEEVLKAALGKLDDQQKEILRIYQNLKAGNYRVTPELVLTPKEMRELKLESQYKIERENGSDRLVEQKDPRNRDVVDLIIRSDSRSMKELRFRMARVEEGLKILQSASLKYNWDSILLRARLNIGEPSKTPPAGTKYLSQLMSDPERFRPDHYDHFPKSITYFLSPGEKNQPGGGIFGLRPVDYLMASMACGPSSYILKPMRADASLNEYLNSPMISSPFGSAVVFSPPGVTTIPNKVIRNEICGHQQSITDLYDKEFEIDGRKHYGFISVVRYYLKRDLRGFVKGTHDRELHFDRWWDSHVLPIAQGLLEKFQTEYYNIVIEKIIPALTEKGVFKDLNDDAAYSRSIINRIFEAYTKLGYTNARAKKGTYDEAAQLKAIDNAIYQHVGSILSKMAGIQFFLLKAAESSKIFPNGKEGKTDITYLANSNAEYLKRREDILKDIQLLGTALKINIEVDQNQEVKINGGLKFAADTQSEAQRTVETAIRNIINNVNELHHYSDMIYLLTKKVDIDRGTEAFE